MANSLWVMLNMLLLQCSLHFILSLTEGQWQFVFPGWPGLIICGQQTVSDFRSYFHQTVTLHHSANNREWVTWHILLYPGSPLTTFHPMTAASEWHCLFCFCQAASLYHHMTNSQWVPLLILFLPSSLICIPWLTEGQWHTCDMSGRLTVFYLVIHRLWVVPLLIILDSFCTQQLVSNITCIFFQTGLSHLTLTNSLWATQCFFRGIHLIQWSTGCEWKHQHTYFASHIASWAGSE